MLNKTTFHDRNIAVDFARHTEGLSTYKLVIARSLHLLSGGEAYRLKLYFFFSSRRRHTSSLRDWSSDVCSSDLVSKNAKSRTASAAERMIIPSRRRCCSAGGTLLSGRSEERRVGKECRSGWSQHVE